MEDSTDFVCIIGSACRLPGAIQHTDDLTNAFNRGNWAKSSTLPPPSREFHRYVDQQKLTGRGGWLGQEGVEDFDNDFFRIPTTEAEVLRPNARLALELTWEALENAGIPPSSLKGRNVSVTIGVGTEDGWDMKRFNDAGVGAFNCNWASSSDPSGIAGRISNFFDFTGHSNTVSNACSSGTFALKDGVQSLLVDGAEVAVVGALATHFSPAPFSWAAETGVASKSGRCSSFSPQADGYSPSEGAVFFVLKREKDAYLANDPIQAIVRSIASGHNGFTRNLMTPKASAQESVFRTALQSAKLSASEISIIEAHGTGTLVGDALEMESIRAVFGSAKGHDSPVWLSSSKTIFGHCHGSAALVGILKVLGSFKTRKLPAHHVEPHASLTKGSVQVSPNPNGVKLPTETLFAQVNAFGFTGSVSAVILQSPKPSIQVTPRSAITTGVHFLPISAKSESSLVTMISSILQWAKRCSVKVQDAAPILCLTREHHNFRKGFAISSWEELERILEIFRGGITQATSDLVTDYDPQIQAIVDATCRTLDGTSLDDRLNVLISNKRCKEAVVLLYESGYNLDFSTAYSKHDVNHHILQSFPHYAFDRKRCWPSSIQPSKPSPAAPISPQKEASPINDAFLDLIREFGAAVQPPRINKILISNGNSVLLTGANGMVGVHLLSCLIQDKELHVYCVGRGNVWSKVLKGFMTYQLDTRLLEDAKARGSLSFMSTADIGAPKLGLSNADYSLLVEQVNEIVHCAWSVNFNLPLAQFKPHLSSTRHLAELAVVARKVVRYHFIGSYASTFNYPQATVPERPLEQLVSYSINQGYAISKLVAEHSLLSIAKLSNFAFQVSIIRVGQICGDTKRGQWPLTEMMPMMIQSLPALGSLPKDMPDVSWIPSDVCGRALRDIIVSPRVDGSDAIQISHVANPLVSDWNSVATQLGKLAGVVSLQLVPLRDYVTMVKKSTEMLPVRRLLPHFSAALEEGTFPERYASLEVVKTMAISSSLASCPPVDNHLLSKIVGFLLEPSLVKQVPRPIETNPRVFVFGPWSPMEELSTNSHYHTQLFNAAREALQRLNIKIRFEDSLLHQQLSTIAFHLGVCQTLEQKGITPDAVIGYCLGEYSAAIVARILSFSDVVEILVHRADALRHVQGNMMNVFAELSAVRRVLSGLASPPDVAIVAGPKHIVVSGSLTSIGQAKAGFDRLGMKNIAVQSHHPFHSNLMSEACKSVVNVKITPQDSTVEFVSGVIGTTIAGSFLGPCYWARHMRETFNFAGGIYHIHKSFAGARFIDIGPGKTITKFLSRYESISKQDILSPSDFNNASQPIHSPVPPPPPKPVSPAIASIRSNTSVDKLQNTALQILFELFGYPVSKHLLDKSLHSLGVQSLDFIRLADQYASQTGYELSLSAFVSDEPLGTLVEKSVLSSDV